jgi:DNA-binding ferritin-like protein
MAEKKSVLTLSGDDMRYDRLKEDALRPGYDPMSPEAGKRVMTYDKELGYAVHPEDKAYAGLVKEKVDEAAGKQQSAIEKYSKQYSQAMSEADARAAGILSDARSQVGSIKRPTISTIPIRVVDASGQNIEGSYNLPRSVADELSKNGELVTNWGADGSFNISVRTKHGLIRGQEIHDAIREATQKVEKYQGLNDSAYDAAKKAGNSQISSLEGEIATQRRIAQDRYDQNVGQANQVLRQIKAQWTTYLTTQRKNFATAKKTNDGGIADLLKSGVLTPKVSK